MRPMTEYFLMADSEDFTKEKATAIIEADAHEVASELKCSLSEARTKLLADIGYYAGYYDGFTAGRVYKFFDTQHPIWGRQHPTPAVAYRMGHMSRSRE